MKGDVVSGAVVSYVSLTNPSDDKYYEDVITVNFATNGEYRLVVFANPGDGGTTYQSLCRYDFSVSGARVFTGISKDRQFATLFLNLDSLRINPSSETVVLSSSKFEITIEHDDTDLVATDWRLADTDEPIDIDTEIDSRVEGGRRRLTLTGKLPDDRLFSLEYFVYKKHICSQRFWWANYEIPDEIPGHRKLMQEALTPLAETKLDVLGDIREYTSKWLPEGVDPARQEL
jgi:hypothetical protein